MDQVIKKHPESSPDSYTLVQLREPCLVGEQGLNSAAPTVFSLKGTMSYHVTHTMESKVRFVHGY